MQAAKRSQPSVFSGIISLIKISKLRGHANLKDAINIAGVLSAVIRVSLKSKEIKGKEMRLLHDHYPAVAHILMKHRRYDILGPLSGDVFRLSMSANEQASGFMVDLYKLSSLHLFLQRIETLKLSGRTKLAGLLSYYLMKLDIIDDSKGVLDVKLKNSARADEYIKFHLLVKVLHTSDCPSNENIESAHRMFDSVRNSGAIDHVDCIDFEVPGEHGFVTMFNDYVKQYKHQNKPQQF